MLSLTSDLIRGHTESIILACLSKADSYGYEINKTIFQKTGGLFELKEATLYTVFRRLEQLGSIVSYWGDETTGARRRYYAITDGGREALTKGIEEWKSAKMLIDTLIEP